jgi:hypothetical protein
MSTIDIAELDCIYLTYDEPKADDFWAQIQANVPWAKRVHGVKGSDAAHKAAASASETERFILIDGDNIPNWEFFNQELRLDDRNRDCVFRWRARNMINGLCYGNGGISSWTKEFVENMRTHENTDGTPETEVEFCFNDRYIAMHDVWSTTHPNQSPLHAWRAGFREGVKLCLNRGKRVDMVDFERDTWIGNRNNLHIWCNLGADVDMGIFAMTGARMGAYATMLDDTWSHLTVQDFDKLNTIYSANELHRTFETHYRDAGAALKQRLGMDMINMSVDQSSFFKQYQRQYENIDIMLPESDYRRVLREAARR